MVNPIPDPVSSCPDKLTATHDFSVGPGEAPVFTVLEGIALQDALTHACQYLKGASASNVELIESIPVPMRALGSAVGHSIAMALALVEASIKGLDAQA
jgi:hypothetical protein